MSACGRGTALSKAKARCGWGGAKGNAKAEMRESRSFVRRVNCSETSLISRQEPEKMSSVLRGRAVRARARDIWSQFEDASESRWLGGRGRGRNPDRWFSRGCIDSRVRRQYCKCSRVETCLGCMFVPSSGGRFCGDMLQVQKISDGIEHVRLSIHVYNCKRHSRPEGGLHRDTRPGRVGFEGDSHTRE